MHRNTNPKDLLSLTQRAQNLCSRQEKCSSDIRFKLHAWGADTEQSNAIIGILLNDGYIDHRRYAKLFASEKARLSRWGPNRIAHALTLKGIDNELVQEALAALCPHNTSTQLRRIIVQKLRVTRANSATELKAKVIRYAVARGYNYHEAAAETDRAMSGE